MASEFLRFLLSALIYGESPTGHNGGSHHWSYRGEAGPGNWSSLYPTCSGTRQSPVDLRDRNIIYQDLPPFHFNGFHGQGGSFTLTNNGHTASIAVVGNLTVEGGGLDGMYKTAELHFHWGSSNNFGSEHSINGRKYPLEMHIVNYAVKYGNLTNAMKFRDGLAVLGTFFDLRPEENPYFGPIEYGLKLAKYAGNYTRIHPVNLYGLLPRDTTRYYRYYGSLTTPPCFQSVMWTLFEDIQYLSPYQMRHLRQLYESHHDSHGGGHHQGGHGLNGHMKAHFPVEQFLMDNFRPIQPDFDRVINCNIPRYADPNFIQRSRQQGRNPQHLDFISQRIAQVNADALLNKTLSKWLLSKGLTSDMLTQEQLAMTSRGLFESQGNPLFDQHALPLHQNNGFPTGHDGGHRRPFVGQGSGHNVLNPSQHHQPAPPPPNPSQLDLQVIQIQKIGPDGQQVSEIQVQVDAASGVSQEQLQVLLEDPSIMDQIQQIIAQQGGVNQTHEIIVQRPPQLNQPGTQQQFGGQPPLHQHHQQQQQPVGPSLQQQSTVKSVLPVKSKQNPHSKFIILSANISDSKRTDSRNVVLRFVDSQSKRDKNDKLSHTHDVPARLEHNAHPNPLQNDLPSPALNVLSHYEYIAPPDPHDDLSTFQHIILPEHNAPLSAQHLDTLEFRSNVIPDYLAHSTGTIHPKRKATATEKLRLSSRKGMKRPFVGFGNKMKFTRNVFMEKISNRAMQNRQRVRFRRAILQGLSPKKGIASIESAIHELNSKKQSDHKQWPVVHNRLGNDLLTPDNHHVDTAAIQTTKTSSKSDPSKVVKTRKEIVPLSAVSESPSTRATITMKNVYDSTVTTPSVNGVHDSTVTTPSVNGVYDSTVTTPSLKATALEQTTSTPASPTSTNGNKNAGNIQQTTVLSLSQTGSAPTQSTTQTSLQTNSKSTNNLNSKPDQTTNDPVLITTQLNSFTTTSQTNQPAPSTSTSTSPMTTLLSSLPAQLAQSITTNNSPPSTSIHTSIEAATIQSSNLHYSDPGSTDMSTASTRVKRYTTAAGPTLSNNKMSGNEVTPKYQVITTTSQTNTAHSPDPLYMAIPPKSTQTNQGPTTPSANKLNSNPHATYDNLVTSTTGTIAQPSRNSPHITKSPGASNKPTDSPSIPTGGTPSRSLNEMQSQLSAPLPRKKNNKVSRQPVPQPDPSYKQLTKPQESQVISLTVLESTKPIIPQKPSTTDPPYPQQVQKPVTDSNLKQPMPANIKSTSTQPSPVHNLASSSKLAASAPDLSLQAETGKVNTFKVGALSGSPVAGSSAISEVQAPVAAAVSSKTNHVTTTKITDPLQIPATHAKSVSSTIPSFQSALDAPTIPAAQDIPAVPMYSKHVLLETASPSKGVEKSSFKNQQTLSSPSQRNLANVPITKQITDSLLQTQSYQNRHMPSTKAADPLQTYSSQNGQSSMQSYQSALDSPIARAASSANPSATVLSKPTLDTPLSATGTGGTHSSKSVVQTLPVITTTVVGNKHTAASVQTPSEPGAMLSGQGYVNSIDAASVQSPGIQAISSTGTTAPAQGSVNVVDIVPASSPQSTTANQAVVVSTSGQGPASTVSSPVIDSAPLNSQPSIQPVQSVLDLTIGKGPTASAPAIDIAPPNASPNSPIYKSPRDKSISVKAIPSPQPIAGVASKSLPVPPAIDAFGNTAIVLDHPLAATNIAAQNPISSLAVAMPTGSSSNIQTTLDSAPFDKNGYFDFSMVGNTPGWSLHSLKKRPREKSNQNQDYSETVSVSDGTFSMGLLDSSSTNLLDTFESYPKSFGRNSFDGGNFGGSDALYQPGPGETTISNVGGSISMQPYGDLSSSGIQNPSSSQFSSMAEAQKYVESLNQGASSGPHNNLGQMAPIDSISNTDPNPSSSLANIGGFNSMQSFGDLSSSGIQNPSSSQFSSMAEAQKYVESLNQGASSGPHNNLEQMAPIDSISNTDPNPSSSLANIGGFNSMQSFGDLSSSGIQNPSSSQFSSMAEAQQYVESLNQGASPGPQNNLGQMAPIDSIGNTDPYSSSSLANFGGSNSMNPYGEFSSSGNQNPESSEFSSMAEAQQYVANLNQGASLSSGGANSQGPQNQLSQMTSINSASNLDPRFGTDSVQPNRRTNQILPEQMPLSFPITSRVSRGFSDKPQGDILPIIQQFEKTRSTPSAPGQKRRSFSEQRQMASRSRQPASNVQRYQSNTGQLASNNPPQPSSFNSGVSNNRVEPLDKSFRAPRQPTQILKDSQQVQTGSNVQSLDSVYRYQGNDQPSRTNRPANRVQGNSPGIPHSSNGRLRPQQNRRAQNSVPQHRPINVNAINRVPQHRQNHKNPAHPARSTQFNQRQSGKSDRGINAVNMWPQHQRPSSSPFPGPRRKVNTREHPSNHIPQHQQRNSIQRNRVGGNKAPKAVQAVNIVNHVPRYQQRQQSPLPAPRGRVTDVHQTGNSHSLQAGNHLPAHQQRLSSQSRPQNKQTQRPLHISVLINQDNKIMKNQVNNHGPGDSRKQTSHHMSQSRNHVTIDADGQVTRRQLPTVRRSSPITTRSLPVVSRPSPAVNRAHPQRGRDPTEFDSPISRAGNPSTFRSSTATKPARRPYENRQRQIVRNYRQSPSYQSPNYHNRIGTFG